MYLVFDVGGTYTKYAVMTDEGNIIEKGKCRTPIGKDKTADDFADMLADIWREFKEKYDIEGIAMGIPGQVDVKNGIVYCGGAIKYTDNAPLGKMVSERCGGIRVAIENDGKCAALAEVWCGNASDADNAVVLVFGTGIGGGIIRDRKVVHGNHLLAGELSYCFVDMTREHLEMLENMPPLEKLTLDEMFEKAFYTWSCCNSTAAIVRNAAKLKKMDPSEMTGELMYQLADQGDEDIIKLLEDSYFSIAKMCCNLYVTLDPDIILIGGGISEQPAFIQGIKRYVERLAKISKLYDHIKLDVCRHLNDSNLLGALYNFKINGEK